MKKLLYLFTLPNDIIMWPIILLIRALWGEDLKWEGMALTCVLKPGSWPMDPYHWFPGAGWYAEWRGTTLGHAIFYSPETELGTDEWSRTQLHEHVHVHQYQASMVSSFLIGCLVALFTGNIVLGYLLWSFGFLLRLVGNWATAWIRGDDVYLDSTHEEHAYAVGDYVWTEQRKQQYLRKYRHK